MDQVDAGAECGASGAAAGASAAASQATTVVRHHFISERVRAYRIAKDIGISAADAIETGVPSDYVYDAMTRFFLPPNVVIFRKPIKEKKSHGC